MQLAYLERGVCEVCELYGESRWMIGPHGYSYCRECAEKCSHIVVALETVLDPPVWGPRDAL